MRLNGAIFLMDWSDIQLTRFDPSVSLLGLTVNAGDARVKGIEVDMSWNMSEQWTLDGAMSWISSELSEDYARSLTGTPVDAPEGTELPFVPGLKLNATLRRDFQLGEYDSHMQATVGHTGSSYNDIFIAARSKQAVIAIGTRTLGTESLSKLVTEHTAKSRALVLREHNLFPNCEHQPETNDSQGLYQAQVILDKSHKNITPIVGLG